MTDSVKPEVLQEIAKGEWSKTDIAFLSDILDRYYRQPMPFELEVYKSVDTQPVNIRVAVQNDPFFQKVGRSIHALDFSEVEKAKFAHDASTEMIAVFLLFEKNLDVLEAVFNNPRLPTKVLLDYVNLIKERDIDRQDDKILRQAQQTLKRRSRRIVKARDILTISKGAINQDRMLSLLVYAMDDDPMIVKAAFNVLQSLHSVFVKEMLDFDDLIDKLRERAPHATGIDIFNALHETVRQVLKFLDVNQMLGGVDRTDPTGAQISLRNSLRKRKLHQLEKTKDDPTDLFNLTVLSYLHLDKDKSIQEKAAEVLQIEDVIEVLEDETIPRRIVHGILDQLEKHPDETIRAKASAVRLREVERLNKKMKEIETSINAYFDVIFQSLGYSRINDQKDAIQVLKGANGFLEQYGSEGQHVDPQTRKIVADYLHAAIQHFQNSINTLYLDTKKELFGELDEIRSMVRYVLDLKQFRFQDERQRDEELDESLLVKAVMIWRTAISQYLGRIKDLEEMLHMKWMKLMHDNEPSKKTEVLEDELHGAFMEIEMMHKRNVDCKLRLPCRECKRRGCASERFLIQVEFMLDEMISNFQHESA